MKDLTIILLGMAAYFWVTECPAATITVNWDGSGDYTTIQAGIDAATDGDEVIVSEGTYNENINFGGKNIILRSTVPNNWDTVEATIIDGNDLDSVVRFSGTETSDCKLLGFTITDGYGPANGDGGGITANGGTAIISMCIIRDNVAQKAGGGMRGGNSFSGLIDRCIVTGNSTVNNHGGGLAGCHGLITNCLIYDNTAAGYGGGIMNSYGDIINCTIVDNRALDVGSGLASCYGNIINCIIWGNDILFSREFPIRPQPTYCCIEGWVHSGRGNISAEPGFVNAAGGDYHLWPGSVCIDAGTNDPQDNALAEPGRPPVELPPTGLDGNPRPLDGNYDGTAVADMGAYELLPPAAPYMTFNQSEFVFHGLESGPNPAQQVLEIRNPGTGSFEWEILEDCEWLGVFPTSGQTAADTDEVTLQIEATGLEPGGYICELTISSREAVNSPLTVSVMLNIYRDDNALIVPLDYATIQAAIDAAADCDNIIVGMGTYNGNINLGGKNIVLRSIEPDDWAVVARTVIQGDGTESVVTFAGTEDPNCLFLGFTVTSGGPTHGGGGIVGRGMRATVANCVVKGNTTGKHGGGIHRVNGRIERCVIYGNRAGYTGGGIAFSNGRIVNCLVYGNRANDAGGGMVDCNGNIISCTVTGNMLSGNDNGSGLWLCNGTITNCIIWGNLIWGRAFNQLGSSVSPTYSCFPGGSVGMGNINAEPGFVDVVGGDYHLRFNSACVDAGDNSVVDPNSTDLDGNPRIINGIVDMGAYEALLPIKADVHIVPRMINRNNHSKRVFAIVRLPEGLAEVM